MLQDLETNCDGDAEIDFGLHRCWSSLPPVAIPIFEALLLHIEG
jgi:hypothetical protein